MERQVSGSIMLRIVRTDDKDVAQIQIVSVWTISWVAGLNLQKCPHNIFTDGSRVQGKN